MKRPGKDQNKARAEALEQAAGHLRAGKLDAALALYQQLYDQEPDDWTVANALGDLHVRMRHTDEAIEVFMNLAEHMAGEGHSVKARALYRKVLRMRPGDPAATTRVAELENEHLDASPFMQRVRGVLLDAQTAAPAALAPPEPSSPVEQAESFTPPAFEPPPSDAPAFEGAPVSFAAFEPPAPIPLATFEPAPIQVSHVPAFSLEPAIPLARIAPIGEPEPEPEEDSAAAEGFEPRSGDWLAIGLTLAAAPLQDRPVESSCAPRRLDDFHRMDTSARAAAANGDFERAGHTIEQFLHAHPNDVEALERLVEVGVDGGLGGVAVSQLRLADASIAAGRLSSARHIALDLLNRTSADTAVIALVDRLSAAGSTVRYAPAETLDDESTELFDDDGLVTDDEPRRPAPVQARVEAPLDDWLDAADETDADEAVSVAARLIAAGDVSAAKATLEPLMATPGLRPIVGVHLAQLYRREGDYLRALHCLEQAAEQPPVHADNAHALAYELAVTLETMGQRSEALGLYRELLSEVGPAFRDVAARAEHLSAA